MGIGSSRTIEEERIYYGGRGYAAAMQRIELPVDLIARLFEFFDVPEDQMLQRGFQPCVDYPQLKQHIYYEGYFHSRARNYAVPSLNARNGRDYAKPPAPVPLRAFFAVFREVNKDVFAEMGRQLLECQDVDRDTALALGEIFLSEDMCGDLSVQVHCGEPVTKQHLGWHYDSINSLFHLALSLHGQRTLFCRLNDRPGVNDKDAPQQSIRLSAVDGSCYLSTPYCFLHAVSYPESTWENRTVAVQCRLILGEDSVPKLRGLSEAAREHLMHVIAEAISKKQFRIPTLEEVLEAEKKILPFEGEYSADKSYLDGRGIEDERAVYFGEKKADEKEEQEEDEDPEHQGDDNDEVVVKEDKEQNNQDGDGMVDL